MRKIELKKGWVIKNHEGKYLDENFWWIEVVKEKAYVHESNPNDIMLMLEKYGSDTCTVCQAMVFNGHYSLASLHPEYVRKDPPGIKTEGWEECANNTLSVLFIFLL